MVKYHRYMILALLIALVILWALGYVTIPSFVIPSITLFTVNGHLITLWNLLIFLVLLVVAGSLPSPLREVLFVVLIIWVLAVLGIIAFVGLSNVLIVAIIAGLIVYLLQGRNVVP